jgi:hypothetical protein
MKIAIIALLGTCLASATPAKTMLKDEMTSLLEIVRAVQT